MQKLKVVHVLIIEDSKYCADLNVRELRRGGFDVNWKRVETEEAMRRALIEDSWDVILSDSATPCFHAVEALWVRNCLNPQIPFILVSEDDSSESIRYAMENGCCAYLLKENLHQLAILVRKILER